MGEIAWVDDEELMHQVTAVSGGGPAYVFLLIEALAEAGRVSGLPADLSMRLARSTVCGSGELAHQAPEPAADLRKAVMSPKGTTEQAIAVLMAADGIQPLMNKAIQAATNRGGSQLISISTPGTYLLTLTNASPPPSTTATPSARSRA